MPNHHHHHHHRNKHRDNNEELEVFQEEEDADDDPANGGVYEQELLDEELARQLARAEERALAAEERARGPPPARPWTMKRACSYIVPILILIVGTVALIYAINEESIAPSTVPTYTAPFFEGEDPWEGLKPVDVARWNNGGSGGLTLDVVDAMETQWENIFYAVIKDWNDGTPKVLELSTEKDEHDPECEPIDNKSKVCNGNYGDSQWRGINQVLIQSGYIVAATSKMNDFYLANADKTTKQYTLCHELGHSFGLAHTDENFFNTPLGNCMDYTDKPAGNERPDHSNFEFLAELYGSFPERQRALLQQQQQQQQPQQQMHSERRIPIGIRTKWREIMSDFESSPNGDHHERGWRLLKTFDHSRVYEIGLGNGYVLRVKKLLVS